MIWIRYDSILTNIPQYPNHYEMIQGPSFFYESRTYDKNYR